MHDNDEKYGDERYEMAHDLRAVVVDHLRGMFGARDALDLPGCHGDSLLGWIANRCDQFANEMFDEVEYGDHPSPREASLDICDCCLAPLAELGEIL